MSSPCRPSSPCRRNSAYSHFPKSLSVPGLFTIGIGPGSSHTVGPIRAGQHFVSKPVNQGLLTTTARVESPLFGSLALTGKGHGTDTAVLPGPEGDLPETVDVDNLATRLQAIRGSPQLNLLGQHPIGFHEKENLLFHRLESLPAHSIGMR